jgi:hypothetical protein
MKHLHRYKLALALTFLAVALYVTHLFTTNGTLAEQTENVFSYLAGLVILIAFAVSGYHAFMAKSARQRSVTWMCAIGLFAFVVIAELDRSISYATRIQYMAWKSYSDANRARILFFEDGSYKAEIQELEFQESFIGKWHQDGSRIVLLDNLYQDSNGHFASEYTILESDTAGVVYLIPSSAAPDSTGAMQFTQELN